MSLSVPELARTTDTGHGQTTTSPAPSKVTTTRSSHNPAFEQLTEEQRPSVHTGHIFQALLGIAACLALTAVISQARETPTGSPDAPPPAVFVQTD